MYWQIREILRTLNVVPDAQTLVVDLPRSNFLSGLYFNYQATTGSTAGLITLPKFITNISVIADGSTEIFSMAGEDVILSNYGLWKKLMPCNIQVAAGKPTYFTGVIPFGRFLGDPNFYLDCGRYASLELRVTFAPTVAATGIATGSQYFTVHGLMAMEAPPAVRMGTLKTARKFKFTSSSSGDVVLDLPRGNVYRALQILDIGAGQTLDAGYSRVALDVNNGEKIIFAGDVLTLRKLIRALRKEDWALAETTTTGPLSCTPTATTQGDELTILFDIADDISYCLNSAQYGKVNLTLSQVASGHDTRVILQEILS
jgi:hypothetical protein